MTLVVQEAITVSNPIDFVGLNAVATIIAGYLTKIQPYKP